MPKFNVRVEIKFYVNYHIDADNKDAAQDIVEKLGNRIVPPDPCPASVVSISTIKPKPPKKRKPKIVDPADQIIDLT